jgi:S-ribosylhomocysteine lyase
MTIKTNPTISTKDDLAESFRIDHTIMPAPQVRKAGLLSGPHGDKISKFDLRFLKPNVESLPTGAIHTLEHLLATYMREHLDNIIDISPMGCRTGFYLSIWGDIESDIIKDALIESLRKIVKTEWKDVPGVSEKECGNYKDHSLFAAKKYAEKVLEGFSQI